MPPRTRAYRVLLAALVSLLGLAALIAWGSRTPPPTVRLSSDPIGFRTIPDIPAATRFAQWLEGDSGPRTPGGLLALFSLAEWSVLALIAFTTLLALMFVVLGDSITLKPASLPRSVRLRTLAILIALVALLFGWEREGGRSWRLKEVYGKKAAANRVLVRAWEKSANDGLWWIKQIEDAAQRGEDLGPVAGRYLFGAYGTDVASMKAVIQRRVDSTNALRAYHQSLAEKYTLALQNPRRPVDPDPPPPLPPPIALR